MKKKSTGPLDLTPAEAQLIAVLREHPEMREQVQAILAIVQNAEGPLKSADEVEGQLIQEMRQLGNTSMRHYLVQSEERVSKELKEQNPVVRSRKKNAEVLLRLWSGQFEGSDLA